MKIYDAYGRVEGSINFGRDMKPYQVDTASDSVTYERFFSGNPCIIWRITTSDNVVTTEKALGDWSNRTTLTYTPLNDDLQG